MAGARERKRRRQHKQALKFGDAAKPRHRLKSGRTGKSFSSMLKNWKRGKCAK